MDGQNPPVLQAITELRLHNSESSRILRLPNELSTIIFSFCVAAGGCHALTALLTLSSVCFYWRELTLHTPSLWADALRYVGELEEAYFPYTRMDTSAMDAIAARAQPLPIYISIHSWPQIPESSLLDNLRKHLHHLGELHLIELHLERMLPDALSQLTAPAPLLESVTVEPRWHEELPILNPDLFARSAPNLKNLRLRNPKLLWNSVPSAFAHVRNLDLSYEPPNQDVTIARLLHVLSTMPQLERLVLGGCPVASTSDIDLTSLTSPTVCLHHLRSIHWSQWAPYDYDVSIPFMRSLSLPSLECIVLYFDNLELEKNRNMAFSHSTLTLRSLCIGLSQHHAQAPLFTIPMASLTISQVAGPGTLRIHAIPLSEPLSDGDDDCWRGFNIIARQVDGDSKYIMSYAVTEICSSLPLEQVKILTVVAGPDLLRITDDGEVSSAWRRACAGMRGLGSVEVKLADRDPDSDVEDESTQDARLAALRSYIMNSVGL